MGEEDLVEFLDRLFTDPLALKELLWPHVTFWEKQEEILRAQRDSAETYVTAGNMLGKDFIAGYHALAFFLVPYAYFPGWYVEQVEAASPNWLPHNLRHRRRVLTTSVKDDHLDVLWGEIGRFFRTALVPLDRYLTMTHHEVRFREEVLEKNPSNYLKGQVSAKGEGLAGHHADYTLVIGDEASGLEDEVQTQCVTWARRALWIGNPLPCSNFFFRGVKGGDLGA